MSLSQLVRLEAALRAGDSSGETKLALSRLLVQLRDRRFTGSANSKDAFVAAARTLGRIRGSNHSELRLECLSECVNYLYSNTVMVDALSAVSDLLVLAKLVESSKWKRIAENCAGIVKADLGCVPDALNHYCNAIDHARQLGDLKGELAVTLNLGAALNYAGLFGEAIRCFEQIEGAPSGDSECELIRAKAASNMAQCLLQLGDFEKGYTAVARALASPIDSKDATVAMSKSIWEFTFVQLALELGKLSEAQQHAQQCQQYALQSGANRAAFHAQVTLALCQIYAGDSDSGLLALERILSESQTNQRCYVDVLSVLIRAYERLNKPSKALECMRILLGVIKDARAQSIKILLASHHAGQFTSAPGQNDLMALHLIEANLRAQAAEQQAVNTQVEMLERLAITADLREEASGEHGYRVGRLSYLLAKRMGWSEAQCQRLEVAARLHDVGKIGIPDRILLNTSELQHAQRQFVCSHTIIGAEILSRGNNVELKAAQEIARHHHEWWDGSGYPSAIAGDAIPIHARIVALADVFDALTHGRPYAAPWSPPQALAEIDLRTGTQFDPVLSKIFVSMISELQMRHPSIDSFLGGSPAASPLSRARNRVRTMLATTRKNEKASA